MRVKPHSKAGKVWFIILACLFALLFAVTLVITQNDLIYYTISSKFGGGSKYPKSGNPDLYVYYSAGEGEPTDKAGALRAANAFNETVCEEGTVLLKNDGSLPLAKGSRVTVFGRNSVDLVYGGSGSNAGASSLEKLDFCDMLESTGGFVCNPAIREYYESLDISRPDSSAMGVTYTGFPTAEAPVSEYPLSVRDSYDDYADAAKVDGGGHFTIMFRIMIPQALPMTLALGIIAFIGYWNDYMTVFMFLPSHPTLATGLYLFQTQPSIRSNYPLLYAAIIIATVPVVVLYAAFQEKIMVNTVAGGLKG